MNKGRKSITDKHEGRPDYQNKTGSADLQILTACVPKKKTAANDDKALKTPVGMVIVI